MSTRNPLVVIAPDKFKGALSAADAAAAIAEGVLHARPQARIVACPMADGGEGTVDALVAAAMGTTVEAEVTGPLPGTRIRARFGILGDQQTAVVEMSAASGLALLAPAQRNPLKTTTFGTGELIREAARRGCIRVILGIGGSATVDGGIGALQALGAQFIIDGEPNVTRPLVGQDLARVQWVHDLDDSTIPDILIACDVRNPLCGDNGAARVFGPQKGASPQDVANLDQWLEAYAKRIGKSELAAQPGTGAAGGLGFGLCALHPRARLAPGFQLVADACGLAGKLQGADLCITAEGRLDSSSLSGKTAAGVARLCHQQHVRCAVLAGSVEAAAQEKLLAETGACSLSILDGPSGLKAAMTRTRTLLRRSASQIAAMMLPDAQTLSS